MLLYFLVSTVPTVAECTVSSAVLPEPPFWLEPEPEKRGNSGTSSSFSFNLREYIKKRNKTKCWIIMKSKAKHLYLSVNKTGPGKVRRDIVHYFIYFLYTELELEPEPASWLAGAGAGSKRNGSTTTLVLWGTSTVQYRIYTEVSTVLAPAEHADRRHGHHTWGGQVCSQRICLRRQVT